MLHFAYGSNMSRALMRARCPLAQAIGQAALDGFAFIVTADGYGSVVRRPGAMVHGALWRIGPRELAALNAYENLGQGLYRPRMLAVRCAGSRRQALVYIGRATAPGRPRPGYMEIVLAAAREWALPDAYVESLARWRASGWRGARFPESGEVA